jgi:hypothetical protein
VKLNQYLLEAEPAASVERMLGCGANEIELDDNDKLFHG